MIINVGINYEEYMCLLDFRTFDGLINLYMLNLSQNKIRKIDPETFNGLTSLKYIDLRLNRIVVIDNGIFDGLTSLSVVKLDHRYLFEYPTDPKIQKFLFIE